MSDSDVRRPGDEAFTHSEQSDTQAKLLQLTRYYAALSQCNQAILRSASEDELFSAVCRAATEAAGVRMAWIGVVGPDSMIVPVASAGTGTEYLDGIRVSAIPGDPLGQGPTGTAVREGKPCWCLDYSTEPKLAPWRERGAKFGWRATAALPLHRKGSVIGALTLYMSEPGDFDDEIKELLTDIAADISFALDGFERELERERAQEALRESEQLLRQVMENSIDGIIIAEPEGRILQVNPAVCRMLGRSEEELRRASWTELVELSDGRLREALEQRRRTGRASTELTLIRGDSTRFPAEIASVIFQGPGGQTLSSMTLRDITERKNTDESLRASESKYRLLAENMADVVWQLDIESMRFRYVSPSVFRLRGYTAEEVLAQPVAAALTPESMERVATLLSEFLTGEKPKLDSMTTLVDQPRKDGSIVRTETVTTSYVNDEGGVEIIGVSRDITDRIKAEERTKLLGTMLDAAPADIVVHDLEGRTLYANRSAAQSHGYALDDFLKVTLEDVLYSEDKGPFLAQRARIASGEELELEVRHLRRDGSLLPLKTRARLVDWHGEPAILSVETDLSDARRAEEEKQRLHASLARSDRLASMGMLAAGVAHEINNPLAYVLYNLETLSKELPGRVSELLAIRSTLVARFGETWLDETFGDARRALAPAIWSDVTEGCAEALQGTRRIRDIARGLGSFARVEHDKITLVDLSDPVQSALSIASNELKYRARIVKQLEPAPVLASDGRISQVFLNLLVNAAQAIVDGDVEHNTVTVRTWRQGESVFAEVRDTGCGIAAENLKRIFDPFYTTKPAGTGSGLGLSIVSSIVHTYGGTISVESEVGKGTRFLLRFPAADGAPSRAYSEPPPPSTPTTRGRVLVVDDERGIRRAIARVLDEHEVVQAESGARACEIISASPSFDVIICDMMMETMSGVDVHRWLLEHYPRLARRLVFLTGGAFTPHAREYLSAVSSPRIEKPFEAQTLKSLVAGWVRESRADADGSLT